MTSTFGPYQLIRKIAQGGMAEVFLASRKGEIGGFSKQVAIKRIYEHLAEDPELITMFFDEGRIAARLNHSNIVQIYDLGQIDSCFYIAMEFVNGCDLRTLAERGLKAGNFLPLPMAARVIASAATGLHYAHSRNDERGRPLNIVHRDVSPQNILISMDGEIKVCDFGIAKAEARMTQTQTGQFKGKFAYMSPEQVLGEGGVIDRRSDIFSLGIILYEITVCTRLFKGKNDYDTIRMVAEAEVPPPTLVRQGFPPDLERIILKALARRPEHRYQTAEQMQMELEEWLIEHRAKTSPVHISRYMHQILPELVERSHANTATQSLNIDRNLASDIEQPTLQEDMNATRDDMQGVSIGNEYADADATGEINVQAFRAALEDDQSIQDAYNQAASASPHYQVARQPDRSRQISAQWSSAPEPDFSAEGAGATRITQAESDGNSTQETPRMLADHLQRQASEPATDSGHWQGPDSYAQSSGQWSSVPREPNISIPKPTPQVQPQAALPQPSMLSPQEPVPQHSQPAIAAPQQQANPYPQQQQWQQPQQQPYAQQQQQPVQQQPVQQQQPYVAQQPHYSATPEPAQAPLHQASSQAQPIDDDPSQAWDVQGTSLSMKHDLKELQRGAQRKKVLYAVLGLVGVGIVIAVVAVVGVDRPKTELSDENKPIDESLLQVDPPQPLARTSVQLTTEPEGAYVVINGVLSKQQTPASFEVVEGQTNQMTFFLAGHQTRQVQLGAGKSPDGAIPLEKIEPVDPKEAGIIEVTSEPLGGIVFHNGVQVGPAPTTLTNLDPRQVHHIRIELKDHHAYSAMLQPIKGEKETLRAVLDPTTMKSRDFYADLSLETMPRGARVLVDGEPKGISPTLFKGDRHKLYTITYEAPNYHPLTRTIETRDFGTLMLRPNLKPISRDPGKVSIKLPSSVQDIYVGPNQYQKKDLTNLELKEGSYPVVVVTSSGKRYEAKMEVVPNTKTSYKLEILNGSARLRKTK